MRKQTHHVSASQPTTTPLVTQHTHEVIVRRSGSTVVIRFYSFLQAEREARWERRAGADVEVLEVAHAI